MLLGNLIKIILCLHLESNHAIVYSFKMALKIDSQRWNAMVSLYRGDFNDQKDIGPFHTYASKG